MYRDETDSSIVNARNPTAAAESAAPPSANHAKSLRKRLLANLASYDTVSKRIRDLPLPEGAPLNGSQNRLQRGLAARGQLFLAEKLGLLRSLGNVEELGGGSGGKSAGKKASKAKADQAKVEEYTVKTLADLLEKEDVAKVRGKVGPELEAAAKLNVLRECVAFPFSLAHMVLGKKGRSALTFSCAQARSARPVVRRGRERSTAVRGRGGSSS